MWRVLHTKIIYMFLQEVALRITNEAEQMLYTIFDAFEKVSTEFLKANRLFGALLISWSSCVEPMLFSVFVTADVSVNIHTNIGKNIRYTFFLFLFIPKCILALLAFYVHSTTRRKCILNCVLFTFVMLQCTVSLFGLLFFVELSYHLNAHFIYIGTHDCAYSVWAINVYKTGDNGKQLVSVTWKCVFSSVLWTETKK